MWKIFKLALSSEAEKDIDETFEYYEAQQEGLGQRFEDDLDAQLELLQKNPEIFARYKEEIRKGNLKKFPYSFYYQNDMPQEIIDILAVFAQAKNPKDIDKELGKRHKK